MAVTASPLRRLVVGDEDAVEWLALIPLLFTAECMGVVACRILGLFPLMVVPGALVTLALMVVPSALSAANGGGLFGSVVLGLAPVSGLQLALSGEAPLGVDVATMASVGVIAGIGLGAVGFAVGLAMRD
ncbi:hypothetical protein [Haloprofundus salinisoli]|uniref:hypothetical protein n=1 Tax=Haloprofundus salinisoli TaxID=2876193 RepID=UPI001CCB3DD7|nr:hypothetical protein [Haloprofundus salinisoli]